MTDFLFQQVMVGGFVFIIWLSVAFLIMCLYYLADCGASRSPANTIRPDATVSARPDFAVPDPHPLPYAERDPNTGDGMKLTTFLLEL